MYRVDQLDRVIRLTHAPRPEVGAPCPLVFAEEHNLVLGYWIRDFPLGEPTQSFAVVRFQKPILHMFGPPDENVIVKHPLADRGLDSHDTFQVIDSSWIRQLRKMAADVDPGSASALDNRAHYIFAFHDSTFECIAESFTAVVEQIDQLGGEYVRTLQALRPRE